MISFEKKSLLKTVDGLYLGPEGFRYSFLPLFYSVVSFVAHILLEKHIFLLSPYLIGLKYNIYYRKGFRLRLEVVHLNLKSI